MLESAVDTGRATNEAEAGDRLVDQLQLGLARADMAVAAQALAAWQQGDLAFIETKGMLKA